MGRVRPLISVAAVLLVACGAPVPETRVGELVITNPYLAEPVTSDAAAVYLSLTNGGAVADTLVALGAAFADHGELHAAFRDGGRTMMRPVDGIAVASLGTVLLEPGGPHGMLVGLTTMPKHAEEAVVTLTFARAGTVTVALPVVRYADIQDRAARSRRAAGAEPAAQ